LEAKTWRAPAESAQRLGVIGRGRLPADPKQGRDGDLAAREAVATRLGLPIAPANSNRGAHHMEGWRGCDLMTEMSCLHTSIEEKIVTSWSRRTKQWNQFVDFIKN
jgi:hypothetical protein